MTCLPLQPLHLISPDLVCALELGNALCEFLIVVEKLCNGPASLQETIFGAGASVLGFGAQTRIFFRAFESCVDGHIDWPMCDRSQGDWPGSSAGRLVSRCAFSLE